MWQQTAGRVSAVCYPQSHLMICLYVVLQRGSRMVANVLESKKAWEAFTIAQ